MCSPRQVGVCVQGCSYLLQHLQLWKMESDPYLVSVFSRNLVRSVKAQNTASSLGVYVYANQKDII